MTAQQVRGGRRIGGKGVEQKKGLIDMNNNVVIAGLGVEGC